MNRSRAGICLIVSAFLVLAAVAAGASGGTEAAASTAAPEAAMPTADFAGLDRDTYFTVAEFERLTGRTIAQYNESPMTAALVAEGELPPVEERLPEQPPGAAPVLHRQEHRQVRRHACRSTPGLPTWGRPVPRSSTSSAPRRSTPRTSSPTWPSRSSRRTAARPGSSPCARASSGPTAPRGRAMTCCSGTRTWPTTRSSSRRPTTCC